MFGTGETEGFHEVEVWFLVTELHEPGFDGETVTKTAYSTIQDAQMMAEVAAGWPGVKRAWVEDGTRMEWSPGRVW